MKKTMIAAALLATFGFAQAQIVGDTTSSTIVQVGPSTVNAGPHKPNKPGVGVDGTSIIDLAGIDTFSYKGTTTSGTTAFRRYQLLGYSHTPSGGTPVTTNFNWFKVPTITQEVYFGIATNPGTTSAHAGFYVGDRTGYAVPTSNTNYAAVGYVASPTDSSTALVPLTGTLALTVSGSAPTLLEGTLSQGAGASKQNLVISATDFTTKGPGSFAGDATYYKGTGAAPAVNGSADGKFFGGAGSSAIAGKASGTYAGSAYVAGFGGKN